MDAKEFQKGRAAGGYPRQSTQGKGNNYVPFGAKFEKIERGDCPLHVNCYAVEGEAHDGEGKS